MVPEADDEVATPGREEAKEEHEVEEEVGEEEEVGGEEGEPGV